MQDDMNVRSSMLRREPANPLHGVSNDTPSNEFTGIYSTKECIGLASQIHKLKSKLNFIVRLWSDLISIDK